MKTYYHSNNELKETSITNIMSKMNCNKFKNRLCYYFDDIININHLDILDNISTEENSYDFFFFFFDIAYKTH